MIILTLTFRYVIIIKKLLILNVIKLVNIGFHYILLIFFMFTTLSLAFQTVGMSKGIRFVTSEYRIY